MTENGTGNGKRRRLTTKQRTWLVKYLQCWNGAEAARYAGYVFPRQSATENLSKPYIQDAIKGHLAAAGLTPELVLSELLAQITFDLGCLVGKGGVINWEQAKANGFTRNLKSISWMKGGIRVEAYSKQRALELVGKHLGLFVERHEHSGEVTTIIYAGNIDPNEV